MKNRKIEFVLLIVCLIYTWTGCSLISDQPVKYVPETSEETTNTTGETTNTTEETVTPEIIDEVSATEVVEAMGVGWNLGNTLDAWEKDTSNSLDTETLWGNPVTTEEMIGMVKEAGFGAVRIPVTYYNHMDENNVIDEKWLARVAEVVDYVLDNDMYCIINIHHDTGAKGWLKADMSSLDENKEKISAMWTQIADYFIEYDEKLLFEGYNEILNSENEWSWASQETYKVANQLNQVFVDTVRSTGEKNAERFLIVNTYAASAEEEVISKFDLPEDTIEAHLIASVHTYAGQDALELIFSRLYDSFTKDGIPVIIGEFALPRSKSLEERITYASYYASQAKKNGIGYFWWDDGNHSDGENDLSNYALLNRNTMTWAFPTIVEALMLK